MSSDGAASQPITPSDEASARVALAQLAGRVGVFDWDLPADLIIWSPELETLYGRPTGSFSGGIDNWKRCVVPEDAEAVVSGIARALERHASAYDYEFRAVLPDGTRRWLAGQASFFYDSAGRPLRMIGVNVDIDDRKRLESRDRFLVGLDDTVRPLSDPDEIVAVSARLLGQHLDVDRCAYAEIEPDQDTMNLTGNYTRGVPSIVGRLTFTSFGAEVLRLMRENKPFVVNDVDTHQPPVGDVAAYRATQIQAVICVPLHKEGRFVAAMAVHSRTPRVWRQYEVELVLSVANRCWESIERARIARSLRSTSERLEAALSAGEVATFVWDITCDKVVVDTNFARLFNSPGDANEERPGDHFLRRIHPDDIPQVRASLERDMQGSGIEYRTQYRLLQQDGSVRWLIGRGRFERDAAGRPLRMTGVVVDVTERELAQQAIAASETRFRMLADSIPQLAWTARPDGTIEWFNRRWYEYTGISPDDAETRLAWEHLHDPEYFPRVMERWRASLASGEPFDMEFPLRGADGTYRMFLTRCEPVRDARGNIVQWIGTNTDIEQKRQLLEAERAARSEAERVGRMKDEFLATLSHELRTPLNAIMGWAQMLRRGNLKLNEQEQAIATIERNARAQTQMIEDLLDMSRIVSGKVRLDVQRVDLADVVNAAITSVQPGADGRKVRLEKILDPHAGPVSGDPGRLQQIVWNLLTNAIKFTPAGGKVQVVLERVNSHLEISVSDTGVGIKPSFLPFVFDRFRQADASTTRQFGGLGLGLSIVKQLVELHGGSVRAKSPGEGLGSTFIVALPLAVTHEPSTHREHPRSAGARGPIDDGASPRLAGLTILVVDDEPDARALIKRVLEERDARVFTAPSANEAMLLMEAERPDVLLSDVGMPVTDGYELIQRVRGLGKAHGGGIPAVALTAFARSEDRRRALLAGFQAHVAKPVDAAELVAVVASLTGRTGVSP